MFSEDLITELVSIQVEVYNWHIGTGSLAEHEAFGDLFDSLHDLVDSLLETAMGRERKRIRQTMQITADPYTNFDACVARLDQFTKLMEGEVWEAVSGNRDAENTIAEIVGAVTKAKFLSGLN